MRIRLGDMTWPEIAEVLKEPNAVLLPIGSTEQHGHHLPVNLDYVHATYAAEQAAKKTTEEHKIRVLVLPTLPYGETSGTPPFGKEAHIGSIGLSVDTTSKVIEEIVRSLVSQGFKSIIVVNGHSENSVPCAAALRKVAIDFPQIGLYGINWWRLAFEVWAKVRKGGDAAEGHGGEMETAMALAIEPENVHLERVIKGSHSFCLPVKYVQRPAAVHYHSAARGVRESGIMCDPTMATGEEGEEIISAGVNALVEIIVDIVKSEGTGVKEIPE